MQDKIKIKGKAYAHRRGSLDRPSGDAYHTPKSLVWVAEKVIKEEFPKRSRILEPCSGEGAISNELKYFGYSVIENDLYFNGVDYLEYDWKEKYVITNPPFSLWDRFVEKARSHTKKFMVIGRLNYLGTHSRNNKNIWEGLKAVYCFDRYVDYQTPLRSDGYFHVGAMATGWFLWDDSHTGAPTLHILDVQAYATLGNFKGRQ